MTHHLPSNSFSRRRFLQGLGGAAALSLLNIPLSTLAYATAGGARRLVAGLNVGGSKSVCVIDLVTGDIKTVPVRMDPHSFLAHPARPSRLWTIERGYDRPSSTKHYGAAEVDIESGEVLRYLTPPAGSAYFGHGFFTGDGSTLFISRVDMKNGNGYLTGYDTDGREVESYHVSQGGLHEVRLMPGGLVLAANSGVNPLPGDPFGGPRVDTGALLHIDLSSGKVLQKQLVEDDGQMVGHFHHMEDDTLIMLSRPRTRAVGEPGKTFTGTFGQGALRQVPYTDRIQPGAAGECLSLAVDEKSKRALVTNPANGRILVLDTKESRFVDEILLHSQGVVFDTSIGRFIAGNKGLMEIDPRTLAMQEWSPVKPDASTNPSEERPLNSAHTLLL